QRYRSHSVDDDLRCNAASRRPRCPRHRDRDVPSGPSFSEQCLRRYLRLRRPYTARLYHTLRPLHTRLTMPNTVKQTDGNTISAAMSVMNGACATNRISRTTRGDIGVIQTL